MNGRIFHGNLTPRLMARALMGEFNRGNFIAQTFGNEKHMVVQIQTRQGRMSGGDTAMSVDLRQVEDGIMVDIGKQAWLGVAASLGQTVLQSWRSPWSLISRLDDLAQDVQSLQLSEDTWAVVEKAAKAAGASFELSERLRRMMCEYCLTANPVGESNCIACGAPLGNVQPFTCPNCGFVLTKNEARCPNCGKQL